MTSSKIVFSILLGLASLGTGYVASAQSGTDQHDHHQTQSSTSGNASVGAASSDQRTLVPFPERLRLHTLTSMRDHLLAVSEIQEALSKGWFDKAAEISETRLGMSSLNAHGAHESSKYMPKEMQDVGLSMHRSASQFSTEAQNAGVTGDLKPVLAALSRTTQACVACHAAYRLQ
jgi:hypothetical protein